MTAAALGLLKRIRTLGSYGVRAASTSANTMSSGWVKTSVRTASSSADSANRIITYPAARDNSGFSSITRARSRGRRAASGG